LAVLFLLRLPQLALHFLQVVSVQAGQLSLPQLYPLLQAFRQRVGLFCRGLLCADVETPHHLVLLAAVTAVDLAEVVLDLSAGDLADLGLAGESVILQRDGLVEGTAAVFETNGYLVVGVRRERGELRSRG
jgi:hypothetical protein